MTTLRIHRWEAITKTAFDRIDRERAVVLVTCAPIEVHGPHLPLGADALEGDALLDRTVRALPERHRDRDFLRIPPLFMGTDTVPQAGSLYFRASTIAAVVEDLGRTLVAQGFRHIWVSNFHGAARHFLAIEEACERVNRRFAHARMVPIFSLMLTRLMGGRMTPDIERAIEGALGEVEGLEPGDLRGDSHAGLVETSQLLATYPDLVDPAYKDLPRRTVPDLPKDGVRGLLRNLRAAIRWFGTETYSGSPAKATAEIGDRLLAAFGAKTAGACAEVLDGALSPFACHSPIWGLRHAFLSPLLIGAADRLMGHAPIR